MFMGSLRALLLAAVCMMLLGGLGCDAAKSKKGKGKSSKKEPVALGASKLVKYLKCDGCKAFSTNLYVQAQDLLAEHKGRKKMGEEPVLELLESICNQGEKQGEWINALDVQGVTGALSLKEQDSCTELVELKDARIDEPFQAVDSKKWEAKKMQKMMKGLGMGAQMYDRDSMAEMMENEGMGDMGGMGGGMGGGVEGGVGQGVLEGMHPPPPPTPTNANAPAFPMADAFENVHKTVMTGVDALTDAVEPLAKTVESVAAQAMEGLRDIVAKVSGKPKSPEL